MGGLAVLAVDRANAQRLPQLGEGTEDGGLGELAAQRFARLGRCQSALLVKQLPQLQHQGRDLVARGFLRSMFPIRIGPQREHRGQRVSVGEKIRLLAQRAQQIQRDHRAGGGEAGQQGLRLLDGRRTGGRLGAAQAGFDKRGRRRRQLRAAGQIKAQGMLGQPTLRVFKGENGVLLLAPVRRPCCLELLCDQGGLFSCLVRPFVLDRGDEPVAQVPLLRPGALERFHDKGIQRNDPQRGFSPRKAPHRRGRIGHRHRETALNPVECPLDILPSIPQDDGAAMGTAGGMLGGGQLLQ